MPASLVDCRRVGQAFVVLSQHFGDPDSINSSRSARNILDLASRSQVEIRSLNRRAVVNDLHRYSKLVDRRRRTLEFQEKVATVGRTSLDILTSLAVGESRRLESIADEMTFYGSADLANTAVKDGLVTHSKNRFQRTGLGDAVLRHANTLALAGSKTALAEVDLRPRCRKLASGDPLPGPTDLRLIHPDSPGGVYTYNIVAAYLDGDSYPIHRTTNSAWAFVRTSVPEQRTTLKKCNLLLIRGFSQYAGQATTLGELAEQLETAFRHLELLHADTHHLRERLMSLRRSSRSSTWTELEV